MYSKQMTHMSAFKAIKTYYSTLPVTQPFFINIFSYICHIISFKVSS